MRGIWILLLAALAGLGAAALVTGGADSVRYEDRRIEGTLLNVITVDLGDPGIRVRGEIARGGVGHLEGFRSFIQRTRPIAAINGTFFHPDGRPAGDLVIGGKLLAQGRLRTGLCLTPDCRARIATRPAGAEPRWSGYETVLCAGPRLLKGGQIAIDARGEGFRDRAVTLKAVRTAVGITPRRQLLLVVVRREVRLDTLARLMRQLGCTEAINFDGGGSTAMYYRGRVITEPATRLSNVLLVERR